MGYTILVVEDHLDSREVLADALEFAGYTVIQAADGPEGEEKALQESPDLILLDISLPTKSGWDVLQTIQRDPQTQRIPVIALTAHARPEDEQRALEAGCRSYIPKPVKPKQVLQIISDILQTSKT